MGVQFEPKIFLFRLLTEKIQKRCEIIKFSSFSTFAHTYHKSWLSSSFHYPNFPRCTWTTLWLWAIERLAWFPYRISWKKFKGPH